MRRHNAPAALAALTLLALPACGGGGSSSSAVTDDCVPAHELETVDEGQLRVGLVDLPPYASTTGDGFEGVDADIVDAIAAMECLEVVPVPSSSASLIPQVQQGELDMAIGDFYRTSARAEVVGLSDPLYLDDMGIISEDGYSTVGDLEGKTVGTVDGYLWVSELRKLLGDDLRLYPSAVNLQQDLEAGRLDVGVDSYGSAVQTSADRFTVEVAEPDPRVAASQQPAQAGLPMTLENTALHEAVNADLATLREDGTIAQVLEDHGLDPAAAEAGEPRLI